MPQMTDPHDALVAFQQGLDDGEIPLQQAKEDPDIWICRDQPNGNTRLSYLLVRDRIIVALAMIVHDGFSAGSPCFGVGYAVHEGYRGKGLGNRIASSATKEFVSGMVGAGVKSFFLEAIVGVDNLASRRIAEKIISASARGITDSVSGLPALLYSRRIG